MYRYCTTKESVQRQLTQCLLDCMMEQPYKEIQAGDLCAMAGISRKTFYRYFERKEDVLYALLDNFIMDFVRFRHPKEESEDLYSESERIVLYYQQNSQLLGVLVRNDMEYLLHQRSLEYLNQEVKQQESFEWQKQYGRYEILFTTSGVLTLLFVWHQEGFPLPLNEMGATLDRLLTHPLKFD